MSVSEFIVQQTWQPDRRGPGRWVLSHVSRHRIFILGVLLGADVNAAIQEAVTGISVAENFRQEGASYATFCDINQRSYRANLQRGFVLSSLFPTLNTLAGIGTAALVY